MIITYQGVEAFKISQGDLVLALNPISRDSSYPTKNFGADVTLVTANHPDLNGADQTSRGEKDSFIINGPGEYEVKDISIQGFPSESQYGGEGAGSPKAGSGRGRINTVYQISFEGMNLCFLGALSNPVLPAETLEALEDIDILFTPIGGEGVLDPAAAYKLAVSLEPKLIIPMHYPTKSAQGGSKTALAQFLKEGGEEGAEKLDKLVVKKKDLEGKEGDIIILNEE